MKTALYAGSSGDGLVVCGLCPHHCRLLPGEGGLCRARRNHDGVLTAESYGKVTAISLDPVEKKPLRHFYPGRQILSLGSYGCNLCCPFCQNHEISMQQAPARDISPRQVADYSLSLADQGNIGVAYTYNEPLVGYEFVLDCARLIHQQGQKNVLVTNGFISREPLLRLLKYIDAMNIDLKGFQADFYRRLGGDVEQVRRTIVLAAQRCHLEVTTLIVPNCNDSEEEMDTLAKWLSGVSPDIPLHISRFFPRYEMMEAAATPVERVHTLADVARRHLTYVYPGNC